MSIKQSTKTSEEIINLRTRKYTQWYFDVFTNWLMVSVVITTAIKIDSLIIYYLVLFPIGIIQLRIGLLSHDAVHGQAMKNKTANKILGSLLTFWPVFISFNGYRDHHMPHHKHAGTKKDPELIDIRFNNSPRWDLPITQGKLVKLLIKDALYLNIKETINTSKLLLPKKTYDRLQMASFWLTIVSISHYYNYWTPLLLWCMAITGPFLVFYRLRGLTEHIATNSTHRLEPKWWHKIIFLPHNTWCHWEHHKYPYIPYYNLEKARRLDTTEPIVSIKDVFNTIFNATPDKQDFEMKILEPIS